MLDAFRDPLTSFHADGQYPPARVDVVVTAGKGWLYTVELVGADNLPPDLAGASWRCEFFNAATFAAVVSLTGGSGIDVDVGTATVTLTLTEAQTESLAGVDKVGWALDAKPSGGDPVQLVYGTASVVRGGVEWP